MSTTATLRIDLEIENPARPGYRRVVRQALVDTTAELSWVPCDLLEELEIERLKVRRFRRADGSVVSRWTGGVSLYVSGVWTADEVVFGEPSDPVRLGARSLEGLNLRVEPAARRLVDAGPAPAALVGSAFIPA